MIEQPSPKVYDELLSIWEEAVRSTHHFLTEADIQLIGKSQTFAHWVYGMKILPKYHM